LKLLLDQNISRRPLDDIGDDFHELGLMGKASPKILWLKCGNVSTDHVRNLLRDGKARIERFGADPAMVCLELY